MAQTSRLLTLPQELRLCILDQLFSDQRTIVVGLPSRTPWRCKPRSYHPAVAEVCHQLRSDTLPLFYTSRRVVLLLRYREGRAQVQQWIDVVLRRPEICRKVDAVSIQYFESTHRCTSLLVNLRALRIENRESWSHPITDRRLKLLGDAERVLEKSALPRVGNLQAQPWRLVGDAERVLLQNSPVAHAEEASAYCDGICNLMTELVDTMLTPLQSSRLLRCESMANLRLHGYTDFQLRFEETSPAAFRNGTSCSTSQRADKRLDIQHMEPPGTMTFSVLPAFRTRASSHHRMNINSSVQNDRALIINPRLYLNICDHTSTLIDDPAIPSIKKHHYTSGKTSLFLAHSPSERPARAHSPPSSSPSSHIMYTPSSVLIAGGSLASLMHALALLASPSPPTKLLILERSRTALLHNQGAGIVASPDVQALLARYLPALNSGPAAGGAGASGGGRDVVVRSRLRHYLSRAGAVVDGSVELREQRMTSWDLLYHVLRWRVEGLESGYVRDWVREDGGVRAEYRNGCVVTGVEDAGDGGGVRVTWREESEGGGEEESEVVDLVIGADGASSTVRRLMVSGVERTYAGYVAWRGTVPEGELSLDARGVFIDKFTFFHAEGTQALGYVIPGHEGSVEPGKRLFNWVWYVNYEEGSADLEELMTDVNGKRHAVTLPVGGMQQAVWDKQKAYAVGALPPQFAEAVFKTKQPFIQAVTDVLSPQNSFMNGKVLLVGDALAGFRPHTAASTGQAAYDALRLASLLKGEIDKKEYDELVMDFARRTQASGVTMGIRSQFGRHPFAG